MTIYYEYIDAPMGPLGPYADYYNDNNPIDLMVGDSFVGSAGNSYDYNDAAYVNVIAGQQYTFTVTGSLPATFFGMSLNGFVTSTTDTGPFSLTLTYTATETATVVLGFSAATPVAAYTATLDAIEIPVPTEGSDFIIGNMTADYVDLLGGNDTYSALGGSDRVAGGLGNDNIDGVCGRDSLLGNEGDDTLLGGNGRDTLDGGADNDYLNGGNQADVMLGGDGNDTLMGEKGDDTITGGMGDDIITGGKDNDLMSGGAGADSYIFAADSGQDTITDFAQGIDKLDVSIMNIWDLSQMGFQTEGSGVRVTFGNGNYVVLENTTLADIDESDFILADAPIIEVSEGSDTITGTSGADEYIAGAGSDSIKGMDGKDTIDGGSGQDTIDGGNNADLINGGSGADKLLGGSGADVMYGDADNDYIDGGSGNEYINGGNANDRIYGRGGDDTLIGEHGNDKIYGGNGADLILGGAGKDIINGGNDNDTIDGGMGDDFMRGGSGADVFVFDDRSRADKITDFEDGVDLLDFTFFGVGFGMGDLIITQIGSDLEIRTSDRDAVTLKNFDLANLDASDFIFADIPVVG